MDVKNFFPGKNNVGVNTLISNDSRLGRVKVFGEEILTPVAISENGYIAIYQAGGSYRRTPLQFALAGFKNIKVEESLTVIHASSIVEVDLLIDQVSGIGGAVVGGLLAGGAGAIIGQSIGSNKTKSIDLKIVTTDFDNPQIIVPLHDKDVEIRMEKGLKSVLGTIAKGSKHLANKRAEEAQQLLGQLDSICAQHKSNTDANIVLQQGSNADELAKYKKLLDDGTITQGEFDAKKKQILGL